jgi:CheY-like chemotaxis protein
MSQQAKRLFDRFAAKEAPGELEKISSIKTHEFRNVRAAARILYGAFDCGDIDDEALRQADKKLKELDSKLGANQESTSRATDAERATMDIESFIDRAKKLKESISSDSGEPLATALGTAKILLVDDEYEKFGWNIVFDSIFGPDRVVYCGEVDEATKHVNKNAESITLVLLDLRLRDKNGEASPEIGLGLLKLLKKDHIDLPVVIFSGVDETLFTRRCLQAGAFDYYVKETTEKDRIHYYLKFKEMIRDAVSHPEWRALWSGITRLPEPNEHLLRAYYFLTTDPENYRIKLLFSPSVRKTGADPSIHAECILHCAVAVEDWVNHAVSRHKKRFDKKYEVAGISVHDLPLRGRKGRVTKLGLLVDEGKLSDDQKKRIDEVLNLRSLIARPRRRGARLTLQDSVNAFQKTLEIFLD